MRQNKFGVLLPDNATSSFNAFVEEMTSSEMMLTFILTAQNHFQANGEETKAQLIKEYEDDDNEASNRWVEYLKSNEGTNVLNLRTYEHFYGQMAFARCVDNFTTYFKDILAEVVLKRPEILKSKEQERLDFILEFSDINDLKKSIAEKKVGELFYKGIDDIQKYFSDRLNIILFKDERDKHAVAKFIKQRNLIVHNRGRITKEFVEEFKDPKFPSGYLFNFSFEDISHLNILMNNFLVEVDEEIARKFDLELFKNW
jgi:hypothetical protein